MTELESEVFNDAIELKFDLSKSIEKDNIRRAIVRTAKYSGNHSIWLEVFKEDTETLNLLHTIFDK